MAEVKVERQQSIAKREAPMNPFVDFFTPMFSPGRLFSLNPFSMMRQFADDMDRTFAGTASDTRTWAPAVDVQRCNGDLVVTAELPGLKKEEVTVQVTDDALVIEGERKREHKEDHEGYHRYERSYGKFYRSIPLPEGVKADAAKAEMNNGVLKISMPAPEASKKVRQIAVEDSADKKSATA